MTEQNSTSAVDVPKWYEFLIPVLQVMQDGSRCWHSALLTPQSSTTP